MIQSIKVGDRIDPFTLPHRRGFWINELPYLVILALTLGGGAYSSTARHPLSVIGNSWR